MHPLTRLTWLCLILAFGVTLAPSIGNARTSSAAWVRADEPASLLASCDLFVLPHRASAPGRLVQDAAILPSQVEIAQYGEYEDVACYRSGSFLGVRFDPPFTPPYTITKIRFPSFTTNGVPARFPSVRLVATDTRGAIEAGPALFLSTAFVGAADGVNEVDVNLTITDPNRTFYWCVEFPTIASSFPNDFPFLRMDYRYMERGFFANSYRLTPDAGRYPTTLYPDRNIIASMTCTLDSEESVPIASSKNLGANRVKSDTNPFGRLIFSFTRPSDVRLDGVPLPKNSLRRTDLLYRPTIFSPWRILDSAGPEQDEIATDPSLTGRTVWTTQAVDRNGHRAVTSSVVETAIFSPGRPSDQHDDADEPNGRVPDATPLSEFPLMRVGTIYPAGDKDFYTIDARPGDEIRAIAGGSGRDGVNDIDLVMALYDTRGVLVASDDNSAGNMNPEIRYTVPARSERSSSDASHRYCLLVSDIDGSFASPGTAPRVTPGPAYVLTVWVTIPPVISGHAAPTATLSAETEKSSTGMLAMIGPRVISRGSVARFSLPIGYGGTSARVRIFDAMGRLVRTLGSVTSTRFGRIAEWEGATEDGRLAPSGIYFARLGSKDRTHVVRFMLVR